MIKKTSRNDLRLKRHLRSRSRVLGTSEKPRLSIFRSNTHIYCQIIDDEKGNTLVSANTKELKMTKNLESANKLGELIAEKALSKGIKQIVFDRSGYKYHGRVKALADSARKAGLEF